MHHKRLMMQGEANDWAMFTGSAAIHVPQVSTISGQIILPGLSKSRLIVAEGPGGT
jgi:hypothetical protein